MKNIPPDFEKVLLTYLKKNYLKKSHSTSLWNEKDTEYFAKGIVALNQNFTKNRAGKYRDYFSDPIMRSGYLAYFLLVNATKVYGILSRFDRIKKNELYIADIGAGPLTMSFGFLFSVLNSIDTIGSIKITIDAYELNKKILNDGIAIMKEFLQLADPNRKIKLQINSYVGNLFKTKLKCQSYDYLLLGNFLNEFSKREEQWQIVKNLLIKCSSLGTKVLFLEPGSKKFTRDLQQLRDVIIDKMDYTVLAPCLHQHRCPLNLTAKSDWCNFTQEWSPPRFIQDFDKLTALKKEYLLYSYLFMQNGKKYLVQHDVTEFVAISNLMKGKGRQDVIGCGEAGRIRFIRSNRDASNSNACFDDLSRGKYFFMDDYHHQGVYELNRNVSVKKKDRVKIR